MPSHEQSPACFLRSGVLSLRCLCAGRDGNQSPDSYASATRPPHTSCFAAAATCAAPSLPRLIPGLAGLGSGTSSGGFALALGGDEGDRRASPHVAEGKTAAPRCGAVTRAQSLAWPLFSLQAFHGHSLSSIWPFHGPSLIPSLQRRPFDSSVRSRAVSADHACGGAVCARASVRGSEHGAA